ncbi:hypothetical protein NY08_2263 [Rhodococcus sp. B7740]|nr:hypothetical protein NY08_2263 [Rhodococcus sp. B7740]
MVMLLRVRLSEAGRRPRPQESLLGSKPPMILQWLGREFAVSAAAYLEVRERSRVP